MRNNHTFHFLFFGCNLQRILLLITVSVFYFIPASGQDNNAVIKEFISKNLVQVNSIDANYNDDSDLETFKKAIGNARIVLLGEQDHGDAPTFIAKGRLIKYLHEQCGFDVLAFESDFYSLNRAWEQAMRKEIKFEEVWRNYNVYENWTRCEQNRGLFYYLDSCFRTNSPLILSGIDSKHFGNYALKNWFREIDSVIIALALPFVKSNNYPKFNSILRNCLITDNEIKTEKAEQELFYVFMDSIYNQINVNAEIPNLAFWKQEIKNLKDGIRSYFAYLNGDGSNMAENLRDAQMADNLVWLAANKYPDKKIIVWAHSYHIAKDVSKAEDANGQKGLRKNMGEIVSKTLKEKVYVLGFTSYGGSAGRIWMKKPYKVETPSKDSFERWADAKKYNFAFINFKNLDAAKSNIIFRMKGFDHYEENADWLNIFDGIFYIKEMYPCKKCDL